MSRGKFQIITNVLDLSRMVCAGSADVRRSRSRLNILAAAIHALHQFPKDLDVQVYFPEFLITHTVDMKGERFFFIFLFKPFILNILS